MTEPVQIIGTWTGDKNHENAPSNLLGGGFLIDLAMGKKGTGNEMQVAGEILGDFGNSKRQFIQEMEKVLVNPTFWEKLNNARIMITNAFSPYASGYSKGHKLQERKQGVLKTI